MGGDCPPLASDTATVTAKNMYALGINADANGRIWKPVICSGQFDGYQVGKPFDARVHQAGSAETLDQDHARIEPAPIDQRESVRPYAEFYGPTRDQSGT